MQALRRNFVMMTMYYAFCFTYVEAESETLNHMIEVGVQRGQAFHYCLQSREKSYAKQYNLSTMNIKALR
uniref:Uncharacterized protein n=1 Tax=Arion vulgaris TaxID=1028688 RepID=A0A0B6XXF7_9EUPU